MQYVQCNAIDCGGTGELHSGGVRSFERTRGWFGKEGKEGVLSLQWGSELVIILLNFLSAPHRALMYQQFFVYIFSVEYVALIFSSLDED